MSWVELGKKFALTEDQAFLASHGEPDCPRRGHRGTIVGESCLDERVYVTFDIWKDHKRTAPMPIAWIKEWTASRGKDIPIGWDMQYFQRVSQALFEGKDSEGHPIGIYAEHAYKRTLMVFFREFKENR